MTTNSPPRNSRCHLLAVFDLENSVARTRYYKALGKEDFRVAAVWSISIPHGSHSVYTSLSGRLQDRSADKIPYLSQASGPSRRGSIFSGSDAFPSLFNSSIMAFRAARPVVGACPRVCEYQALDSSRMRKSKGKRDIAAHG